MAGVEGNGEDADSTWGKRRMLWGQILGTEFSSQWNLQAKGRDENQVTGRGKGMNETTGRRRITKMRAGGKYGNVSGEDRRRWGGLEREGWAWSSDGKNGGAGAARWRCRVAVA